MPREWYDSWERFSLSVEADRPLTLRHSEFARSQTILVPERRPFYAQTRGQLLFYFEKTPEIEGIRFSADGASQANSVKKRDSSRPGRHDGFPPPNQEGNQENTVSFNLLVLLKS
jgi:hypothetical protein